MKKRVAAILDAIEDELVDWGRTLSLKKRRGLASVLGWGLFLVLAVGVMVGLACAIQHDVAKKAAVPETCRRCGGMLER